MPVYTNRSFFSLMALNQDCTPLCAFLCIFTSYSSRCTEVIAVNVSVLSYHSFLDCYPGPEFGVLIFQGILQHCQRQPKGMPFQNKSQLLSDNDMKITESVMSF